MFRRKLRIIGVKVNKHFKGTVCEKREKNYLKTGFIFEFVSVTDTVVV